MILLKKQSAFSLLEMLMVFVLLFIFLAAASPFMKYLLGENVSQSTAFALTSTLDFARQTAVQQMLKVRVCASSDAKHCDGQWQKGWLIVDEKNQILRINPIYNGGKLIWNSSSAEDEFLEFLPTGFTNGQRGTFYICSPNQNFSTSKIIAVITTGRWSIRSMNSQDWQKFCLDSLIPRHEKLSRDDTLVFFRKISISCINQSKSGL